MTVIISGNGPAAFPDANGNLGLGTTTPTAKLQISSPGGWSAFNYGKGLYVTTTGGAANPAIGISDYTGSNNWGIINASGKLFFSTMPAITDSSSSTTTRIVVDTSGNLGIGTESPGSKLDIISESAGDGSRITNYMGSSATGLFLTLRTARGTVASPSAVQVGDRIGAIGMGGSTTGSAFYNSALITSYIDSGTVSATSLPTYMSFWTTPDGTLSRTERMRIDSSGNVGIGTASPVVKLHVATSTNTGTAADNAGVYVSSTNRNGYFQADGSLSASLVFSQGLTEKGRIIYDHTSNFMAFGVNGAWNASEKMRIDSSGNVGIGTSSPAAKLHVTSATQYDGFRLSNGTYTVGYITGNTATNDDGQLTLLSGGVAKASILANGNTYFIGGNVGIGTSSPGFSLDISQAAPRIRVTATTGTNSSQAMFVNTGGTAYVGLDNSSGGLGGPYTLNMYHTGAYSIVFSNNSAERMRIDSSGNVGIGTASPGYKLDVSGSFRTVQNVAAGYVTNQFENSATNGYVQTYYNVGSSGANGQASIGYAPGVFFAMGPTANDTTTPIVFRNSNATERMRIDSSGNVGIGTSSPYNATTDVLTVARNQNAITQLLIDNQNVGASAQTRLALEVYGGGWYIANQKNGNNLTFTNVTSERMRIDSSGNVGIGTSSPGNKLDIVSAGSSQIRVKDGVTATAYYDFGRDGTDGFFGFSGAQTTFSGYKWSVSAGTEVMRITNAGNVGIGRTPANAYMKLDVEGMGRFVQSQTPTTGAIIIRQNSLDTYGGTLQWVDYANVAQKGYIQVDTAGQMNINSAAGQINIAGHALPATTNTYDLGSSSYRWRNIYTQDLHLSNGIGDYTVVEGEEDLFLVNNKSGKTFKFALIEVDPSTIPPKSET